VFTFFLFTTYLFKTRTMITDYIMITFVILYAQPRYCICVIIHSSTGKSCCSAS